MLFDGRDVSSRHRVAHVPERDDLMRQERGDHQRDNQRIDFEKQTGEQRKDDVVIFFFRSAPLPSFFLLGLGQNGKTPISLAPRYNRYECGKGSKVPCVEPRPPGRTDCPEPLAHRSALSARRS